MTRNIKKTGTKQVTANHGGPMQAKRQRHQLIVALYCVLFVAMGSRLIFLSGDPSLLVSTDHITDEGWWSQNARNHLLFGKWVMDEHNPGLVMTPVYSIVQRLVLSVLGSGFAAVRLSSALSLIVVVGLVLHRLRADRWWALFAGLLIASNPLLFAYSRVAFVEPVQLAAMAVAWYFATATQRNLVAPFLAGFATAISVATKPTAAPLVVMSMVAPWLDPTTRSHADRLMALLRVVLGGLLGASFVALFLWPYREVLLTEFHRESTLMGPDNGYVGVAMPLLFGLQQKGTDFLPIRGYWSVVAPTVALYGSLASSVSVRHRAPLQWTGGTVQVLRISAVWFGAGLLSLMIQSPLRAEPRYWLNVFVPTFIIASSVIGLRITTHKPWAARLLEWLSAIMLSMIFRPLYLLAIPALVPGASRRITIVVLISLVVGVAGALHPFICRVKLLSMQQIRSFQLRVVATVIVTWLLLSWTQVATSTFTIRDASRSIGSELPMGSVLTGRVANTMSLETDFFAYDTRDLAPMGMGEGILNENFRSLRLTHVVSTVTVEGVSGGHGLPIHVDLDPVMRMNLVPTRRTSYPFRYVLEVARAIKVTDAVDQETSDD